MRFSSLSKNLIKSMLLYQSTVTSWFDVFKISLGNFVLLQTNYLFITSSLSFIIYVLHNYRN